ncbi:unnamed protein product [Candida verbasci]|uniref:Thioredoxin-like fold domain-containing protein n=1 Tax=Candida verbasci TaxID=1227364 RepID=A0A9W4TZA4_9ASCO|nr:unnamed protein product [Candida verbasci]
MISPKYSFTHYYLSCKTLSNAKIPPHIVNLYVDYNCPFSAKLFLKFYGKILPELQSKHPDKFQFVYVNVVQPWHPNSVLLNEFSLVYAKLLRELKEGDDLVTPFWDFSKVLYENKEEFYDNSNIKLTRNEIYEQIYDVVSKHTELKFEKDKILNELQIKVGGEPDNAGNGASADIKYFTKYLRGVGVHATPTVSIDGVVEPSISSGTSEEELIKIFESKL